MQPERHYWFRAKRYGFGYSPSSWQGWAVIAAWCVVFTALTLVAVAEAGNAALFALSIAGCVALTLVLVIICWRSGEPARWRWGK